MWSKTYGDLNITERGYSVTAPLIDGAITLVGSSPSKTLFLRIRSDNGELLNLRRYQPTQGFDIVPSTTGATDGCAATGMSLPNQDALLLRINNSLQIPGSSCPDSIPITVRNDSHKLDSFTILSIPVSSGFMNQNTITPTISSTLLCGGTSSSYSSDEEDIKEANLFQNYPNPFNPVTSIRFDLPEGSFVKLKVYDISGIEVKTLVNELREFGRHEVTFDGTDLSSGVYYFKIETGGFTDIKRMILIK